VIGVETGNGELVCMACHNPNITSSGHTMPDVEWNLKVAGGSYTPTGATSAINIAMWSPEQLFMLGEWGVNINQATNGALQLPVTSNNMKDMIHGIHAGHDRVAPWRDARYFRNNQTMLDFSRLGFPGNLDNCQMCHIAGQFSAVPANALVSTQYYRNDISTPGAAATSMAAISPNDLVISPYAAACVSCHDGNAAKGHMVSNGAKINVTRAEAAGALEGCQVCHGPGAEWDAAKVHK
jgi:OmcA/MtrC family decaheme c-type cytochrome